MVGILRICHFIVPCVCPSSPLGCPLHVFPPVDHLSALITVIFG
jgi:hypothetical protein